MQKCQNRNPNAPDNPEIPGHAPGLARLAHAATIARWCYSNEAAQPALTKGAINACLALEAAHAIASAILQAASLAMS